MSIHCRAYFLLCGLSAILLLAACGTKDDDAIIDCSMVDCPQPVISPTPTPNPEGEVVLVASTLVTSSAIKNSIPQITLAWPALASLNPAGTMLHIERKVGTGDFAIATALDVHSTMWTDHNVEFDIEYSYRLKLSHADFDSVFSNVVIKKMTKPPVIVVPKD